MADANRGKEFDPGAVNQDLNKKIFKRKYGVETQLPNMYIMDACIYPQDLNYFVRVCNYVRPDDNIKCKTFAYTEGQEQMPTAL